MTIVDDEIEQLKTWLRQRFRECATVAAERLAGSLWRLDIQPKDSAAATATIIASDAQTVLEAGRTFRLEVAPLPTSRPRVEEVITAIAAGRLTERVAGSRGRFSLRLLSGETIRGGQSGGIGATAPSKRTIDYAPYAPGSDE